MKERTNAQFVPVSVAFEGRDIVEYEEYYEDPDDEYIFCFYGDLEIGEDLSLDDDAWTDGTDFTKDLAEKYNFCRGVFVTSLATEKANGEKFESPLKKVGMLPGDTIRKINGYSLETDMSTILEGDPKTVEIEYMRVGEIYTTTIEPCYEEAAPKLGFNATFIPPPSGALNSCGVCVLGNLKIHGSVINLEDDYGSTLYVSGNLEADNIIAGGSRIQVDGTTTVKNYVFGHYNHGLVAFKNVVAKGLFMYDHWCELDILTITDERLRDLSVDTRGNPDEFINPEWEHLDEYINPKYDGDIEAIIDAILAGEDIVNPER